MPRMGPSGAAAKRRGGDRAHPGTNGEECAAGFFEVNLTGKVDAVMYKSRLYTKRHLWTGFSAQAFRNQADNQPYRRDLYMEMSFCR